MKMLIAALVLQSGEMCRQEPYGSAIQGATATARACVATEARALRRSRERADIVADAAITLCRPRFETVRARLERCTSRSSALRTTRIIQERFRAEAAAAVVAARARR